MSYPYYLTHEMMDWVAHLFRGGEHEFNLEIRQPHG